MLDRAQVGDEVVTAGGIYGEVTELDDDEDVMVADRAEPRGPGRASGDRRRRPRTTGRRRAGDDGAAEPERPSPNADRHRIAPATLSRLVTDRRKYLLLIGADLAAVVGAVLLAVPGSPIYKKPTSASTCRAASRSCSRRVPPKGHPLTPKDLDRSVSIMQSRINKLGVSEPEIRKQGSNQIVIQLAGVHDPAQAAALIGKTAQLDALRLRARPRRPVEGRPGPAGARRRRSTTCSSRCRRRRGKGEPEAYYLFKTTTKTSSRRRRARKPTTVDRPLARRAGPDTQKELLQPYGGKVPRAAGAEGAGAPHRRRLRRRRPAASAPRAAAPNGSYYYLFKYYPANAEDGPPELTGKDLARAGIRADIDQNGQRVDAARSSRATARTTFQKITKRRVAARQTTRPRGPAGTATATVQNYASHFAIVLDQQLKSTPYIDYTTRRQDGIAGGAADRRRATSPRRRTSRSSCRPVRCRSASSRSSAPTSRRRSARTR